MVAPFLFLFCQFDLGNQLHKFTKNEGAIRYYLYFKLIVDLAMLFDEQEESVPVSLEPTPAALPEEDKAIIASFKTIRFHTLVTFFNRFSNMRGIKKTNYAKEFIRLLFKANRTPQFTYPIIRLMLPADDRQRGNYGLKEKNLSKVIAESLNITKEDYLRLHHFKNPSFHKNGVGIGDFSLCAFDVIKSYCKEVSTLTIHELNDMLDQLVASSNNQIPVFRKLFTTSNAQEIMWIIRIILKDLKVSIKIDTILNTFHKDASDYYNLTNSLLETCKKFQNPNVSLDDQIKIFFPIRPMLAGKKKIGFFRDNEHITYYVETKYDGERLQAHKSKQTIKLFSRNAIDYTKLYEQFVDVLNQQIIAEECILDGQIIVLEKETHKMAAFGMNKMVALNKEDQYQLCFMIFDILWLKEENQEINLMKYPLRQRKEILAKIVKEKQGILQVVKFQQIILYDEIVRRFSESIDRNQEGIMLKDPSSLYIPKERGSNWTKLKGDYIDGLTDTLDLIILGGYYGDSSARHGSTMHWTDQITSFLLGVIDRIDPLNPKIAYAVPFAKVGTGYSVEELAVLREKLKDNLVKFDSRQKPSYLQCNWKPALQDKPDCWIRTLSKSIILEIKAAEMIVSQSYPTRFTLRFPRVVKIRYDKDWSEAQTVKDIEELSNNTIYSKHLKRKLDDSDSDKQKESNKSRDLLEERTNKTRKKTKVQKKQGVYEEYLCYNMDNQKLVSHLFHNFEFCVFQLQNQKYKKSQIEREIMLHDGVVVQNPMFSTQYIITDTIDFKLRAFQSQKNKKYTFIKPSYVVNCINANKILPLSPLYLTALPQGNAQFYRDNFDRFGDSYTNYLDLRQLDELIDNMNGQYVINDQLIKHISLNYRRKGKISYGYNLTELQKVKLKMHGNVFVRSLYDSPNSIIVNGFLTPSFAEQINEYKKVSKNVVIEFVDDLIKANLL